MLQETKCTSVQEDDAIYQSDIHYIKYRQLIPMRLNKSTAAGTFFGFVLPQVQTQNSMQKDKLYWLRMTN
jgi:hypothetical protein